MQGKGNLSALLVKIHIDAITMEKSLDHIEQWNRKHFLGGISLTEKANML